jgi:prepilin-type processing-associated H-X9-DG protein
MSLTLAQSTGLFLQNGAGAVALPYLAHWLGATITIDATTHCTTLTAGKTVVTVTPSSDLASVNGKVVTLPSAVLQGGDALYLPLPFVSETFHLQSAWNANRTKAQLTDLITHKQLICSSLPSDPQLKKQLFAQIRKGDLDAVEATLAQDNYLLYQREKMPNADDTPLSAAVQNNQTAVARYLIEQGADLSLTYRDDKWSLMHIATRVAVFPLHLQMLDLLCAHNVDVNAVTSPWQETPLLMAVRFRSPELVDYLLRHGADPNIAAMIPQGEYQEQQTNMSAVFNLLWSNFPDVYSVSTAWHCTPLLRAILDNSPMIVNSLLQHGADPNIAMTVAPELRRRLESQADAKMAAVVNLPEFGKPIMVAEAMGNADISKLLIDHGATPLSDATKKLVLASCKLAEETAEDAACIAHLKQMALSSLMYAQDNRENLPPSTTIWTDLRIDAKLLHCPQSPDLDNGYGYNMALSGVSLGNVLDPSLVIVFADCKSTDHLLHSVDDIDRTRHGKKFYAAFLDGHVALVPSDAPVSLGY